MPSEAVADREVSTIMRFDHATDIAASRGGGQDRAASFTTADGGLIVALADGAGGTGGGGEAAQAVIDAVDAAVHDGRIGQWDELLADLDRAPARLGYGQTTAVIARTDASAIVGASVGDSGAWLIGDDLRIVDLTASQHRKPLLGSGAFVTPFAAGPLGLRTLLVASDGLFKYAQPSDIARIATQVDLRAAASALIGLARLPSGGLQDDIAVVLVRIISDEGRAR